METMISIFCTAYNQEKYISDAIESFLMQKTSYPFEVLIHDDASTDNTAKIIKRYENENPKIIKAIYQTENQYSTGGHIYSRFLYPRAKGKYIALCEGDDYWTDRFKLQKQAEYLESHPQCSLCTHAARKVTRNKKLVGYVRPSKSDKIFTTEEVIVGGGGLFATNSMFYPKKLVQELPAFHYNAPVGDYPLTIYLSLQGEVYYMDQYMSDYRVMVENSWTSRTQTDKLKIAEHNEKIAGMLEEFNLYTDYKYAPAISQFLSERKLDREFSQFLFQFDLREIRSEKYIARYNALNNKQKIRLYIGAYLPFLVNLSRKMRQIT